MGSDTLAQVAVRGDGARVVAASGLVVRGGIAVAALLSDELLKTVTLGGTFDTVDDHLVDLAVGAGVLDSAVLVAGTGSIVALHQTGVDDTVVCSLDTDTAVGLLHDNGQNETGIHTAGGRDSLDGLLDVLVLLVGVVVDTPLGAAIRHSSLVGLEELVELGDPFEERGPPIGHQPIATKHGFIKTGTAFVQRRTGIYVCRLAVERGCYRRPRNEGEAAGSQKLMKPNS